MHAAIPEQPIMRITFATTSAALEYQAQHGGWVFSDNEASNAEWFHANHFTASAVFRCTNGRSGKLL